MSKRKTFKTKKGRKNHKKTPRARGTRKFTPAEKEKRSAVARLNRQLFTLKDAKRVPPEASKDKNNDWWYEHHCAPRTPPPPCGKGKYEKEKVWKNRKGEITDRKICCYSKKNRDFAPLAASVTRGLRVPGKDYRHLEIYREDPTKVHDPNYKRQIREFMEQNPDFINSEDHAKFIKEVEAYRKHEKWWADKGSSHYLYGTSRDHAENAAQAKVVKDVLMSYGKGDRRMAKLLTDKIGIKKGVPKELSVIVEEFLPPSSG